MSICGSTAPPPLPLLTHFHPPSGLTCPRVYAVVHIPRLHDSDARLLQSFIGGSCCPTCASSNRDHFSTVVSCAVLGITFRDAQTLKGRWGTYCWRQGMRRAGVFDRLQKAGILAPLVDWQLVADGRYTAFNPFAAGEPRKRLIATYRAIVEGETTERRRRLAEAAGGAGDGLAWRSLHVGELRNLTPGAKRLMRNRARRGHGGGADALAGIGEDEYVQSLNAISQPLEEAILRMARRDREPARRLDAFLVDYAIPEKRLVAVPPAWLRPGQTWKVLRLPARIIDSSAGPLLDVDGHHFELDGLDRVPADMRGIHLPRVAPRISPPVPF